MLKVKVSCIACKLFSLKDSELRNVGFGLCKRERDPATYHAARYERECSNFVKDEDASIAKRRKFVGVNCGG